MKVVINLAFIRRLVGTVKVEDVNLKTARAWVKRGVRSAYERVGDSVDEETDLVWLWSFAFEQGAKDCARFAKIILSDPAVKGRELEALDLIGQGLGHAAIVASLKNSANPAGPVRQTAVIAFQTRLDKGSAKEGAR